MRSAFFVKTQSLRKKNISRNNNLFLNNNKYDINSKIQKNLFNTQYKTQDEYLQSAYKRLKRGNYNNLEEFVRKYLREYKHYEEKEEDLVVSHYNYKNLKRNLYELNSKIEQNDIGKKTERLYFNNHLSKRIFPLLTSMKEKEMNINRLEKFISSGVNKYK
jgi:RecG-like helicase